MNDHLLTEQEQIQLLKTWLKTYAPTILVGIIVAVIIMTSWRAWQTHRNKVLLHASIIFDEMLTSRAQNNANIATAQAQKLVSHYKHTPYAGMASLMLARDSVLKKKYPEAIKQLDWTMAHASDRTIRQIARLREARIMIAEKDPKKALNLLKKINDKAFIGLIDETRGDAFLAMNDKSSALKAYGQALAELPNAEVTRPILQMKFENLSTEKMNRIL